MVISGVLRKGIVKQFYDGVDICFFKIMIWLLIFTLKSYICVEIIGISVSDVDCGFVSGRLLDIDIPKYWSERTTLSYIFEKEDSST